MEAEREKQGAGKLPPADPSKFNEAIDAFRRKDPITDDELDALTETERERAFWVSGVADADMVQQVYDAIDSAIENGTTLEDFKAAVGDGLEEAWGSEEGYRLDTVFRTNLGDAYSAGRYEAMTAPEILDARPYWTYRVVEDDRTSDICQELDDEHIVLPADDPFFDHNHPPLHHSCRTEIAPLTPEEAADEGISDGAPEMENGPDDGFGKAPSVRGEDWAPDPANYDKDIGDVLKERLGL
jgi:SPP1 gp7 family putative phage head morphogenesis protein